MFTNVRFIIFLYVQNAEVRVPDGISKVKLRNLFFFIFYFDERANVRFFYFFFYVLDTEERPRTLIFEGNTFEKYFFYIFTLRTLLTFVFHIFRSWRQITAPDSYFRG
jgi:hypothetical protein